MNAKELFESKKFWTLVAAVVAALAAFFTVSCSSIHYVTQSASTFRSGDTTTTVIRYEQVGSFKKR